MDFASYDERAKAAADKEQGGKKSKGRFGSAALNSMNAYAGGSRAQSGKKTGVAPKTSSQGALGGFGGGAGFADAMSKLLGGGESYFVMGFQMFSGMNHWKISWFVMVLLLRLHEGIY